MGMQVHEGFLNVVGLTVEGIAQRGVAGDVVAWIVCGVGDAG